MMRQDETENQQTFNQYAVIWNYNANVVNQNNYYGDNGIRETAGEVEDAGDEEKNVEKSEKDMWTEEIVAKLKPMFYGDEEAARSFLKSIIGLKPKQVTAIVNRYVDENKLSDLSCHRDLYTVLHDYGLYKLTESNWNQQVR